MPNPPVPVANANNWQDPRGRVGLTYPATWFANQQLVMQMQQMFPGYVLSTANPQTLCGVDVIFFDNAPNANTVVQAVVGTFQQMGVNVQTGQAQQGKLGGRPSVMVPVLVQGPNGEIAGVMNIVQVPGGMIAVNIGGPKLNLQASMPELMAVLASVKIAN